MAHKGENTMLKQEIMRLQQEMKKMDIKLKKKLEVVGSPNSSISSQENDPLVHQMHQLEADRKVQEQDRYSSQQSI